MQLLKKLLSVTLVIALNFPLSAMGGTSVNGGMEGELAAQPTEALSANVESAARGLSHQKVNRNHATLRKEAEDLEAVFLSVMIEPMIPDGEDSQLFGGGQANSIYRSLMIQEYGKTLSAAGGVGLADGIVKNVGGL